MSSLPNTQTTNQPPGTRQETDRFGTETIEASRYWGVQTERAKRLFKVSYQPIPASVIHSLGLIKKIAAKVNAQLGRLDKGLSTPIQQAAEEVATGQLDGHFPLGVWQTGSGTATHMNVNEVIANRANELLGKPLGSYNPVHPNDHVNAGQSTNDTFPTAIHITAILRVKTILIPSLEKLIASFNTSGSL